MDTIATISTPLAKGAVGIVRMTGENALNIAAERFSSGRLTSFCDAEPNFMYLGTFAADGFSDKVLAVFFKAPRSYTGEDVVEFHCHGGVKLITSVFSTLCKSGARPADKGEFTRRAFLNGKLSLSDAEGIVDMINGESRAALNAASRLAEGSVAAHVRTLQDELLDAVASMEASLDYPEEMEEESKANSALILQKLDASLKKCLDSYEVGRYVKNGINVAIIGAANVGKSSLLNALTDSRRAIVTDVPGTTRDSVEESIEVNGITLRFIDTAGIRDTSDKVEALGVERSRRIAAQSDVVIFLNQADKALSQEENLLLDTLRRGNAKLVRVLNKADLGVDKSNADVNLKISAKFGTGIEHLKDFVASLFYDGKIDSSGEIFTSSRHADALKRAHERVIAARRALPDTFAECVLTDMRAAYRALGEITGDTADENIIDAVFSKFCLGK